VLPPTSISAAHHQICLANPKVLMNFFDGNRTQNLSMVIFHHNHERMWEQNIFSKKEKSVTSTKIYINKSRGKQRKPWYLIRTYMKSTSTKKTFEGDILKQHVWKSLWEFKIALNHDREGWKQKKTCENDSLTKDVLGPTSARKLGKHLFVRKKMWKRLVINCPMELWKKKRRLKRKKQRIIGGGGCKRRNLKETKKKQ